MATHNYVAPFNCPACGVELVKYEALSGPRLPRPGDFSVCDRCAEIVIFFESEVNGRLGARVATPVDLDEVLADEPTLWGAIMDVQKKVRKRARPHLKLNTAYIQRIVTERQPEPGITPVVMPDGTTISIISHGMPENLLEQLVAHLQSGNNFDQAMQNLGAEPVSGAGGVHTRDAVGSLMEYVINEQLRPGNINLGDEISNQVDPRTSNGNEQSQGGGGEQSEPEAPAGG